MDEVVNVNRTEGNTTQNTVESGLRFSQSLRVSEKFRSFSQILPFRGCSFLIDEFHVLYDCVCTSCKEYFHIGDIQTSCVDPTSVALFSTFCVYCISLGSIYPPISTIVWIHHGTYIGKRIALHKEWKDHKAITLERSCGAFQRNS